VTPHVQVMYYYEKVSVSFDATTKITFGEDVGPRFKADGYPAEYQQGGYIP
jgi:hypothetical protein